MLLISINVSNSNLSAFLPDCSFQCYFNVNLFLVDRGSLPESDRVKSQKLEPKPKHKSSSGITGRLNAVLGLQVSRRQDHSGESGHPGEGFNFEKDSSCGHQ